MKGFPNRDFGSLSSLLPVLLILAAGLLLAPFTSCVISRKHETIPYPTPSTQVSRIIEILDYQGRDSGAELAEWVSLYINGGITVLEKMEEFEPYFVFVAEQSSPDLNTLLQWANNFSLERDIPQLVLLRVYRRLTGNLSINPDDLYGSFFETFIKLLTAQRWPLSQKYAETWVLVRRVPLLPPPEASGTDASEQALPEDSEEASFDSRLYMYLILGIIEKTELESQMRLVMNEITLDKSLSKDQQQAINSIKSNLFNGF